MKKFVMILSVLFSSFCFSDEITSLSKSSLDYSKWVEYTSNAVLEGVPYHEIHAAFTKSMDSDIDVTYTPAGSKVIVMTIYGYTYENDLLMVAFVSVFSKEKIINELITVQLYRNQVLIQEHSGKGAVNQLVKKILDCIDPLLHDFQDLS